MKNKVALVTGGSRGIGFGIAKALAEAGFNLAINGVREESAALENLEILRKYGYEVIYVQGNIGLEKDRNHIFHRVMAHFEKIHVLVNNAGIAPKARMDILEATEEIWDEVMQTNLKGPYFLTQLFAQHFIAQKSINADFEACLINVSSISAFIASVNRGEYCISKAGIAMATKLWATRLGEYDIPVYEIQPGIIKTDMTAGVVEKYDRLFEQGISLEKRWGLPDDVGKVAVSMATGHLPYATGQVVIVDGGLHIQRL